MELTEAIRNRRSIRRFEDREVPRKAVERILDTARWAPSGNNVQPWRFMVVAEKGKVERLSQASNQGWIAASPMVIVCLADLGEYGRLGSYSSYQPLVEAGMIDDMDFSDFKERREGTSELENRIAHTLNAFLNVAIIIDHITLLAHQEGLGTCWVRYFNAAMVRSILEVPDNFTIVALLPIGYPAESDRIRARLEVDDLIIRWE
ncbi:MAG: nitroreductase family protein [Thermoplasmata archaeon]